MPSAVHRRSDTLATGDSLSRYLEEIAKYQLLTPTAERELAFRVKARDAGAQERLVCANLRFVVSVAKKYQNLGVPLSDLINDGNIGLMRAAQRFDPDKGVRFISYAVWWIRQAIFQALAHHGHAVRLPVGRVGVMRRLNRRANVLRQELGREPTQAEVADDAGVADAEAQVATLPLIRTDVSLDAAMGEGDGVRLVDVLADDDASAPDEDVVEEGLGESMVAALGQLQNREAQVLRLHFGLEGREPMTLDSIGERMGVTRERVRQIKEKALSRLRKSPQATALQSFHVR